VAEESPTLALFDVDGTLIRTEGPSPHTRAFKAAFEAVYGMECRFTPGLHGMTDLQIFMTLAKEQGLGDSKPEEMAREACRRMTKIYQTLAGGDSYYIKLPGVDTLLETLSHNGVLLGLVTGNVPEIALHKLASVGLASFFAFGAFGSEALDRNALPPLAVSRAQQLAGIHIEPARVIVLGDTPRDVICALENGYRSVAVATGNFREEELFAAGAELVLPDLKDPSPLMRLINNR